MLFLKEKELKRISESPTFSAISSYSHPPSFLWTEIAYLPYQNAQLKELTQPAKKGLFWPERTNYVGLRLTIFGS